MGNINSIQVGDKVTNITNPGISKRAGVVVLYVLNNNFSKLQQNSTYYTAIALTNLKEDDHDFYLYAKSIDDRVSYDKPGVINMKNSDIIII